MNGTPTIIAIMRRPALQRNQAGMGSFPTAASGVNRDCRHTRPIGQGEVRSPAEGPPGLRKTARIALFARLLLDLDLGGLQHVARGVVLNEADDTQVAQGQRWDGVREL